MNIHAIVVSHCPELAVIAVTSLREIARVEHGALIATAMPRDVPYPSPIGWTITGMISDRADATAHARGIELARSFVSPADAYLIFDDDAVVLSERFRSTLEASFASGFAAWGGYKLGADMLQSSCLAITASWFEQITTFASQLPAHDTTGLAQRQIRQGGGRLHAAPEHMTQDGWPTYGPDAAHPLWAHLGGGTAHAPVSWTRQIGRRVKAAIGSEISRDFLVKAKMRQAWIGRYGGPR